MVFKESTPSSEPADEPPPEKLGASDEAQGETGKGDETVHPQTYAGRVCIYIAELERFLQIFGRCVQKGILHSQETDDNAVAENREFTVREHICPHVGGDALQLEHVIRLTDHDKYPLKKSKLAEENDDAV